MIGQHKSACELSQTGFHHSTESKTDAACQIRVTLMTENLKKVRRGNDDDALLKAPAVLLHGETESTCSTVKLPQTIQNMLI